MPVWRALLRLAQAIVRDPLWAVGALATSPWYAGRYLLRVLLLSSLVGSALMLAAGWLAIPLAGAVHALGWQTAPVDQAVHLVLWSAAGDVTLMFLARQLVAPLLLHFGDHRTDSHGSARFATAAELAPLLAPHAAKPPALTSLTCYSGAIWPAAACCATPVRPTCSRSPPRARARVWAR